MDWFAVTSYGSYPTATPTDLQRAAYAVSYGLLNLLPSGVVSTRGIYRAGIDTRID